MSVDMNTKQRPGMFGTPSGLSPRAELGAFIGATAPLGLAQHLPEGPLRAAGTAVMVPVAAVTALGGGLIGGAMDAFERHGGQLVNLNDLGTNISNLTRPLTTLRDRLTGSASTPGPTPAAGPDAQSDFVAPPSAPAANANANTAGAAPAPERLGEFQALAARASSAVSFSEPAAVPKTEIAFPRGEAGFVGTYLSHGNLEMNVQPSVEKLSSALGPDYDSASDKVFALVPETTTNGTEWKRHDLTGEQTSGARLTLDVQDDNAAAVLANGVAFGVETNVGTAWMQRYEENYAPQR